nr:hypothetical protein [Cohnella sp. WQ 127256]
MLSLSAKPKPPKLLFIFCDSRAHEAYSDHFIRLDNHGIDYDLVFLDGITSAWIGMHKLESTASGAGKTIAVDEYAPAPLELPKDYDGVVIPEIDLDNASRIASGLKGTVKSEIVFAALLLNKPVWIGQASPGVKRADRQTLKVLNLTKGYTKLFLKYMAELQELGITLVSDLELTQEPIHYFQQKSTAASFQPNQDVESQQLPKPDVALITADWVSAHEAKLGGSLEVGRNTIISPLAKDLLRDRGIVLQYSDKG